MSCKSVRAKIPFWLSTTRREFRVYHRSCHSPAILTPPYMTVLLPNLFAAYTPNFHDLVHSKQKEKERHLSGSHHKNSLSFHLYAGSINQSRWRRFLSFLSSSMPERELVYLNFDAKSNRFLARLTTEFMNFFFTSYSYFIVGNCCAFLYFKYIVSPSRNGFDIDRMAHAQINNHSARLNHPTCNFHENLSIFWTNFYIFMEITMTEHPTPNI